MFAHARPTRSLATLLSVSVALAANAFGASYSWQNSSGGAWSQASNWNPNGVPTSIDAVAISLNAPYTITAFGSIPTASLTLNAPLATLRVDASDSLGSASFSGYPITITAGRLQFAPINGYSVLVSGSTLDVGSGGFVDMLAPSNNSSASVSISSDINNAGTFTDSTPFATYTGTVTNTGNYLVGTPDGQSTSALFNNSGAFVQSAGNLTLQNSATLKINNSAFLYNGGTISNTNTSSATGLAPSSNGAIVFSGNSLLSTTTADGHGAIFTGFQNLTLLSDFSPSTGLVVDGNSFFGSATLNVPSTFNNNGSLTARSDDGYTTTIKAGDGSGVFVNNYLFATDSNVAGRAVTISGKFVNVGTVFANSDLTFGANASNSGDIHLAQAASLRMNNARFNQDGGTLGDALPSTFYISNGGFNYNGGQVNLKVDLSSNSTLSTSTPDGHNAVFVAHDTLNLSGDLANHTNLDVNAESDHGVASLNVTTNAANYGTLSLHADDGYGVTMNGNFINAGTLQFETSTIGVVTLNGTLVNTGTINQTVRVNMNANVSNAGTLNIGNNAGLFMTNARFNQDSGTLGNSGETHFQITNGGFNYNGGQVKLTVDTFNDSYLTTSVANGSDAMFNMYQTGRLHGDLANNTSINSTADGSRGGAAFYVDAASHNYGTLSIIASDGYGNTLHIGNDHDTFTNLGVLNFIGGSTAIAVGEITNYGGMNVKTNTYFYGNITNNGFVTIAKGSTAYITDHTSLFQNGVLTINGTLNMGNGSLLVPGALYTITIGGTLNAAGTLDLPSGGTLNVAGAGAQLNLVNGANISGRIVASGAGNIVASGAGNVIVLNGGELITNDGGSLIGNDGASIVASGAGNIVATGAGNIVATGAGNIVASGAGNIRVDTGSKIVATGAGNAVGGGNQAIFVFATGHANAYATGSGFTNSSPTSSILAQSNGTITLQGGTLIADNLLQIDPDGTLTGYGTANVSLATSSGHINPTGGALTINAPLAYNAGSIAGTSPLLVNNSVTLNASLSLGATLKTTALTLNSSTLDLSSGKLILQPADKSAALAMLQSEIATGQITAATLPPKTPLALLDNAVLNKTTFGGAPVDANSLLVAPELLGDANADGAVDLTDLAAVLNNFGTATSAWTSGNFNGAATIDDADLGYVLANFGTTFPTGSIATTPLVATPEPASLALIAGAALALLARRRPASR